MKKVCFTFVFNDYDTIKPVPYKKGWEFYLITDRDYNTDWDIIRYDDDKPPHMKCREVLSCPHRFFDYDRAFGIGGKWEYKGELDIPLDVDFIGWKHGRNCIYDEAEACIRRNKDNAQKIRNKVVRLKRDGFPSNFGMLGTGFTIREGNERVKKFGELWWEEINRDSFRDQLAFHYVLWKHPIITFKTMEFENKRAFPHKKSSPNW